MLVLHFGYPSVVQASSLYPLFSFEPEQVTHIGDKAAANVHKPQPEAAKDSDDEQLMIENEEKARSKYGAPDASCFFTMLADKYKPECDGKDLTTCRAALQKFMSQSKVGTEIQTLVLKHADSITDHSGLLELFDDFEAFERIETSTALSSSKYKEEVDCSECKKDFVCELTYFFGWTSLEETIKCIKESEMYNSKKLFLDYPRIVLNALGDELMGMAKTASKGDFLATDAEKRIVNALSGRDGTFFNSMPILVRNHAIELFDSSEYNRGEISEFKRIFLHHIITNHLSSTISNFGRIEYFYLRLPLNRPIFVTAGFEGHAMFAVITRIAGTRPEDVVFNFTLGNSGGGLEWYHRKMEMPEVTESQKETRIAVDRYDPLLFFENVSWSSMCQARFLTHDTYLTYMRVAKIDPVLPKSHTPVFVKPQQAGTCTATSIFFSILYANPEPARFLYFRMLKLSLAREFLLFEIDRLKQLDRPSLHDEADLLPEHQAHRAAVAFALSEQLSSVAEFHNAGDNETAPFKSYAKLLLAQFEAFVKEMDTALVWIDPESKEKHSAAMWFFVKNETWSFYEDVKAQVSGTIALVRPVVGAQEKLGAEQLTALRSLGQPTKVAEPLLVQSIINALVYAGKSKRIVNALTAVFIQVPRTQLGTESQYAIMVNAARTQNLPLLYLLIFKLEFPLIYHIEPAPSDKDAVFYTELGTAATIEEYAHSEMTHSGQPFEHVSVFSEERAFQDETVVDKMYREAISNELIQALRKEDEVMRTRFILQQLRPHKFALLGKFCREDEEAETLECPTIEDPKAKYLIDEAASRVYYRFSSKMVGPGSFDIPAYFDIAVRRKPCRSDFREASAFSTLFDKESLDYAFETIFTCRGQPLTQLSTNLTSSLPKYLSVRFPDPAAANFGDEPDAIKSVIRVLRLHQAPLFGKKLEFFLGFDEVKEVLKKNLALILNSVSMTTPVKDPTFLQVFLKNIDVKTEHLPPLFHNVILPQVPSLLKNRSKTKSIGNRLMTALLEGFKASSSSRLVFAEPATQEYASISDSEPGPAWQEGPVLPFDFHSMAAILAVVFEVDIPREFSNKRLDEPRMLASILFLMPSLSSPERLLTVIKKSLDTSSVSQHALYLLTYHAARIDSLNSVLDYLLDDLHAPIFYDFEAVPPESIPLLSSLTSNETVKKLALHTYSRAGYPFLDKILTDGRPGLMVPQLKGLSPASRLRALVDIAVSFGEGNSKALYEFFCNDKLCGRLSEHERVLILQIFVIKADFKQLGAWLEHASIPLDYSLQCSPSDAAEHITDLQQLRQINNAKLEARACSMHAAQGPLILHLWEERAYLFYQTKLGLAFDAAHCFGDPSGGRGSMYTDPIESTVNTIKLLDKKRSVNFEHPNAACAKLVLCDRFFSVLVKLDRSKLCPDTTTRLAGQCPASKHHTCLLVFPKAKSPAVRP